MSSRRAQLIELLQSVRSLSPNSHNARRLLAAYQRAYHSDRELCRMLRSSPSNPQLAIDGMTEPRTAEEFEQLLAAPDTMTLEIPSDQAPNDASLAMVVVPYATASPESIARFRQYYLGDVFAPNSLRFDEPARAHELQQVLDQGNVIYLAELVSDCCPTATLALLIAIQVLVVQRKLGLPSSALLGKCLDFVALRNGSETLAINPHGNRRVKRLATSLGLRRVATASQPRPLAPCHSGAPNLTAELTFGLYLGCTTAVAALADIWGEHLPAELCVC